MGDTTTLRLYNTLTRKKEDFVPIDRANVRMYVCGPTVYDFAHIGNARPVIVFDVLYRLLKHLYPGPGTASDGGRVTYVRNITDVDDKINARAARDFPGLPLNEAIRKVTETTAAQYHKDVAALGALEPTVEPRATENIPGMQSLISTLIGSHHAYQAAGEVLFDVSSMPDYGKLSGRNLEDNVAGARVAVEAHKRNPADFVLWKQSSPGEPGWDSPWGRGRPGWHIECSAMSERYLGKVFDIHAGGLDLIFPHHENEIAQSRCAHGTEVMANYWLHNGFLQVEGQKMSKSLGNFVTIHDLLETEKFGGRRWDGKVLRLAMLMTHYREPIDFSLVRLEEAERRLRKWRSMSAMLAEDQFSAPDEEFVGALLDDMNSTKAWARLDVLSGGTRSDERVSRMAGTLRFVGLQQSAEEAMSVMRELSRQVSYLFRNYVRDPIEDRAELDAFYKVWEALDVNHAITARLAALNAKDFAKADQIRTELLAQGIQLMDYKDEAGQRQTRWEVKR